MVYNTGRFASNDYACNDPSEAPHAMNRLLVLFNLKPGVTRDAYERWAREVDLPTVRGLKSIERFDAYRICGALGSDAPAPYQYAEVIDVRDMSRFGIDIGSEQMRAVATRFSELADACFLVTEPLQTPEAPE